jgi:hypothetical protein
MDEERFARAIRSELRRRDAAPGLAAVWMVLGLSFVFGAVAVLGWLGQFLQHHKLIP